MYRRCYIILYHWEYKVGIALNWEYMVSFKFCIGLYLYHYEYKSVA